MKMSFVATKWFTTAIVTASMVAMTAGSAFAQQSNTSFVAHYNQSAATEAKLMQQAQVSGNTNATVTGLLSTIENINSQITALFASEQALVQGEAKIPRLEGAFKKFMSLNTQRQHLLKEIRTDEAKLKKDWHHRQNVNYKQDKLQLQVTLDQLKEVNLQLSHPDQGVLAWKKNPYDGGLTALQTSIVDLQKSSLHYTQELISLLKVTPAPVQVTAASIAGLAYANASLTIPAAGSAAVTDVVAVRPVVKDSAGNVVADAGSYGLSGPAGAQGVTIDSATGTVTVNAGATPGAYVVTYAQSGVSETVTLTVAAAQ